MNWAVDMVLLVLVGGGNILMLKAAKTGELRRSKTGRRTGLKRTPQEQLRREQRREVHVERSGWTTYVIDVLLASVAKLTGIDGCNIRSSRVPICVSANRMLIGIVRPMRKPCVIAAGAGSF